MRRELQVKGIEDTIIDATLESLVEHSGAYRAGQRRATQWLAAGTMDYGTFRRKMWDFLRRRGFGTAATMDAVARLWGELGEAADDSAGPDH